MIRLGRNELALGRYVSTEEVERRIDAVTPEDVAELARELLTDDNFGLAIVGPVDELNINFRVDAA
jgi:predicted Zn-dependent peptidase